MNVAKRPALEGFGPVRQHGYVVANIERSISQWTQQGLGPWILIRNVTLNSEYLGKKSYPRLNVALAYQGDLQIELIEQLNQAPSPYQAMIEAGEFGLHHRAYLCADINASIERAKALGLELCCDIHAVDGSRYAYFSSQERGGLHEELLQATWLMKAMFRHGTHQAERLSESPLQREVIEFDLSSVSSGAQSTIAAIPKLLKQCFKY